MGSFTGIESNSRFVPMPNPIMISIHPMATRPTRGNTTCSQKFKFHLELCKCAYKYIHVRAGRHNNNAIINANSVKYALANNYNYLIKKF